ncbi:MAG: hypothetical protein M1839_001019 [Geoglossum umbratile]|nr:MAG: hypothetical protein M1839_001019 [Geoglossum umbratile]
MEEEIFPIKRIPAGYIEKRVTATKVFEVVFAGGDIEFDRESCLFRYRDADGSKLHTTAGVVTIDQQVNSMKAAIRAYEISSKEEYSVRWDPEGAGAFDIQKALEDVKKSTEEYLKKGEGKESLKAKVRGCLRKFSENAQSFTVWLDFLPNDTYGSLIYGGVSVILAAASKIGHARDGVLEALAEIPDILANAGIFNNMYKDSPRVHTAVSNLYVATLLALEYILFWFHQSAASMAAPPTRIYKESNNAKGKFFKSKEYDDNLGTRISNIKECAKAVRREAELCQQEININTNRTVQDIRLEQANIAHHLSQYLNDHISSLLSNHATALKESILNDLYGLLANTQGMQMLEEQSRCQIECNKEPEEPQYERPLSIARRITGLEPQVARRDVTGYELLNLLNTPFTKIADSDIRTCLRAEMSYREQDRVHSIVQSPKLKSFFSNDNSAVLLVNGNTGSPHNPRSSVSFFSATLVELIRALNIPVIHFFCGLHRESEPETFSGPDGMMRALLQQLLSIASEDHISLKKSTLKKLPGSNKRVRKLVGDLLVKRRRGPIFCIIDSISFFEIPRLEKRLKMALETLMKAVGDHTKGSGVVKLLVTTPQNSRCVSRMVRVEEIFSVPDISQGTGQGLNRGRIKVEVKQAIGAGKQRK